MLRRHSIPVVLARRCAAGTWAQEQRRSARQCARAISRARSAHRAVRPRDARARAAELATRPHSLPPRPEGEGRERLTYDQYRSIRFDPTAAIWGRENRTFAVDLLYPGFIFDVPVNINLVVGRHGAARAVHERASLTHGPDVPLVGARRPEYTGYSGLQRARTDQRGRLPRRVPRVPRRELLPRRREGPALRLVRARPRRPHGAARRRRVSRLHGFLDRASAGGRRAAS